MKDLYLKRSITRLNFVDKPAAEGNNTKLCSPYVLNYLVTFRCSTRCIYCYAESYSIPPPPEMPLERVKEIIDEANELEVLHIYLGGGDALCSSDFWQILPYIIEKGIIAFVSTKTILTEAQVCKLRDIGLKTIQVSIDTLDEKISKYLLGVDDYPSRMIKVIKKLINSGIKTSTNTVITPYNVEGIPSLIRLLISIGVSCIALAPYGRSLYRHSDDLFLSLEQYDWLSEQVEKLRSQFPNTVIKYNAQRPIPDEPVEDKKRRWKQRALCSGGKEGLVIHPDGKVTICEELPRRPEYIVGDVSKQSLMEVWNSDRLQEAIMPPREKFKGWPCYDCEEFEECHKILGRCVRDALKIYGTIYAPPPQCPKAPFTTKRLY
ncbi:MAG: radical SAM protein [bacterium]